MWLFHSEAGYDFSPSHRDPRVRLAIKVVTSSDNVVVTGLPTVAVIYPEHPGCPDPTRVNGFLHFCQ